MRCLSKLCVALFCILTAHWGFHALCYIVSYRIVSYVLDCIALHCIVLHYIIVYYIHTIFSDVILSLESNLDVFCHLSPLEPRYYCYNYWASWTDN